MTHEIWGKIDEYITADEARLLEEERGFVERMSKAREERLGRLSADERRVTDAAEVLSIILEAIKQGSPKIQTARMYDLSTIDTTTAIAGMDGEEQTYRTSTRLTLRWGNKLPTQEEQLVIDDSRSNLLAGIPNDHVLVDYYAISVLVTPREARFNPGNAVFLDPDRIVLVEALLKDARVAYPAFARAVANPQRVFALVPSNQPASPKA